MRTGFVSAILATLMGAAVASAQPPEPPAALPPPQPVPVVPPPEVAMPVEEMPEPVADGWVEDLRKSLVAPRFWVSGTYLYWWLSERGLPPLITRGSTSDLVPGAINQPGTLVLFGGGAPDNEARSGGRFHAGLALNSAYTLGLEADFLIIPHNSDRPTLVPINGQVVARPYVEANTGAQAAAIVSSPDLVGGGVTGVFTNALIGGELNLRAGLYRDPNWYVSMLAGSRYLQLDERVEVNETIPITSTLPVFGADRVLTDDQFRTRNSFFGGQLGLECEYAYEHLRLNLHGKVALGNTHEVVNISGQTALGNVAGPLASPPPLASGLLALPTNIGNYSRDHFTALPEAGFSVGWCINARLRLDVGYTLLYWSGVARAGDQIDYVINPTQIPSPLGLSILTGPARPSFLFPQSSLLVQGINFRLEWRY